MVVRSINAVARRIVTTADMDPDEAYYIRFKSALEDPNGQFTIDYFEYVPTFMVNQNEEDIW